MSLLPWVPYLPVMAIGLFAAILWIVALVLYLRMRPKAGDLIVDAEVYDYATYTGRAGRTMYRAAYRAQVNGRLATGQSFIGKSWKSPPIGTRVKAVFRAGSEPELRQGGLARYTVSLILVGASLLLVPPAIFAARAMHTFAPQIQHATDLMGQAGALSPAPGPSSPAHAAAPPSSGPVKLPLAQLASISDRQLIDAPAYQGDLAHLDPIANIQWATAIATSWAPDAHLFEFHGHMTRDGTWELAKYGLRFSFASPQRLRAATDEQSPIALDLVIAPEGVYAIPTTSKATGALTNPSCPLASALAIGARAHKLGDAEHSTHSSRRRWRVTSTPCGASNQRRSSTKVSMSTRRPASSWIDELDTTGDRRKREKRRGLLR